MLALKIKQHVTPKKIFATAALVLLVGLSFSGVLHAQSVTQGYGADAVLQRGLIVRLQDDDANKVEPLNADQIEKMLGVVVNPNDSPVTLSGEGQQVFVATIGRYEVLVSDQNGAIDVTDYISISSLNGIGMKSGLEQQIVLGRALSKFDGKTDVVSTSELTDSRGGKQKVNIGKVQVDIAISKNPEAKSQAAVPQALQKIGQAIAGKSVSAARIYMSIAVFLIGAVIAGSMLYSGIRSSITAIGRNPLSKKSIMKSLISVIIASLIVFFAALFGVYLLLKL